MPSYRKVGRKWQATVLLPTRLPNGRQKRATKTHPSKQWLREWATALEAAIDSGRFVDPRAGDTTLAVYREQWASTRVVADATNSKHESHWRNHVAPAFGGHPLATINRSELRRWVYVMSTETCRVCRQRSPLDSAGMLTKHKTSSGNPCAGGGKEPGLGPWTIQGAVSCLSAVLTGAVEDGLLAANPAAGLRLPTVLPKPVFYWTKAQAALLVSVLDEDPLSALMIDLDMHTGLRLGELTGLKAQHVHPGEQGIIWVVGVQTRTGWREYPKSALSRRPVPIPKHLVPLLRERIAALGPDDIVFAAPEGGAWDDTNFRRRVFDPAVRRAGIPKGTPHDMRHTAASWLVQAGVDLYRVQSLLGHESFRTTQKYAHLAPGAFDSIHNAWE